MSDIVDLERRITAALERIGQGVEALKASKSSAAGEGGAEAAPSANNEALLAELEDERVVNAQLTERLRVLKEKHESAGGGQEELIASLRAQVAAAENGLAKLKATNAKLRENNAALRAANASGVGQPHLINKSMLEELEALRATRETDVIEVDAILAELKDVLEGGSHA